MKIFIQEYDEKAIGGGYSFLRNLLKAIKGDILITKTLADCDIMFIPGPTLATHEMVDLARNMRKQIIFRVDNIPEDYRNRGTAVSRLKIFSEKADCVVYQSEWARDYVMSLTGVDGPVIYNGTDKDIFNAQNRARNSRNVLYVRSSTNENKRFPEAKYHFRELWRCNPDLNLLIVGNFGDYVKLYGQDFIDRYRLGLFDEPMDYLGQISDPRQMADIYRESETVLIPYYNDACSNTLIEARSCGCKIDFCTSGMSGGNPEIMKLHDDLLGIDRMGKEYLALFDLVLRT